MAETLIQYRFVVDGHTPATIPQAELAGYMADLAELYGDEGAVHFLGLESSSLCVVSGVSDEEDADERIASADTEVAAAPVKRAYQSLVRRISGGNASYAFIEKGTARLLDFPTRAPQAEVQSYGPFWQQGQLSGTVILLGGKTDRATVKIQDANGDTLTCKANRLIVKRLRPFLYEQPIRVTGHGKWLREATGLWRMQEFDISDFVPLDDDPLTDVVARLRAIDSAWKDRPDPLAELDEIRNGH